MKKKIIGFIVAFILLFTDYAFAYTRINNSASKVLFQDATTITDQTIIDRKIFCSVESKQRKFSKCERLYS